MKILITGGTNGIGLAVVKKLLSIDSYQVHIVCRNINKGKKLGIQNLIEADLSDLEQINKVKDYVKEIGGIDILINNAGIAPTKKMIDMGDLKINKTLIVNLVTPYLLTKTLLDKKMVKKIIMVSSVTHWCGNPTTYLNSQNPLINHYFNSKFSLMCISLYFDKNYNTEIISINPGYVDTGIWNPKGKGELLHKPLRKIFALKPSDTVELFLQAIENKYDNHVYITPYKDNIIINSIRKYHNNIMLLNDFIGKIALKTKNPNFNSINPKCYFEDNINKVYNFLKIFDKVDKKNKFKSKN